MKQTLIICAAVALASCTHLPVGGERDAAARAELWHEAHMALYAERFEGADSAFALLASEHAGSEEGREAHFYRGAISIDPRNPAWNPERAETALRSYLRQDTLGTLIHRRPEATVILEIARQLNLPPEERVAGLQPEVVRETQPGGPPRTVAPAAQVSQLLQENEALRRELVQRDDQIRRQREELERIRRALTPRNSQE